ncbi:DUF2157 domain-containing protein [Mesorhizobium sp. L-8-3]|uniref:DUF2157 domain-containing protein n=1 Tax=Mesorhizobium sp. L-8-3 TaxID=2744522 RepID=UPI001925BE61|nr:DUF2157 domain-containing protein [Mesorhizobium sp. L-8-3]BCH25214.1 hypothetical protein MesoLjLb_49990 [Mesorhizobium sp. L-8-3]
MATYSARVKKDIARWVEQGLIGVATADALSRDVEANERRSLSFGSILAILAAILFGAAILLVVAANWEGIPRLVRVGLLFALILAGYVGGAFLKLRQHEAFGEALWLVGAAAFGGSIALIGQMYHLAGDEAQAVLTWCLGTGLAAAALRSGPLTVAAAGLAAAWLFLTGFEIWRDSPIPHLFLAIAAALWLISYWTRSRAARHLILLSLIGYVALLAVRQDMVPVTAALAAVSAVLFALAVWLPVSTESVARIDGRLPVHGLIGFLVGMAMLQAEIADDLGPLVLAAAVTFAGAVAALVLGGRESRGLRWIAYLGFALELCFVYAAMLGTMLGTAGFLLAAGVILALLALVIIRVERRMNAAPQGVAV